MRIPRVKVVCFFYNEEPLSEIFIRHYRWADCIHAVVSKSIDRTREVLAGAPNVVIEDFEFPAATIDDFIKRDKVNEIVTEITKDFDWFIVVDADEFIWPSGEGFKSLHHSVARSRMEGAIEYLAKVPQTETVLIARMWNVYRHVTESDIDLTRNPVALQRRHGNLDRTHPENAQYQKPIIIRANYGFQFVPGNHGLYPNVATRVAAIHSFDGAHWQNADPSFCVTRRTRDRRDRQSVSNLKNGLGSQHHHIQESQILALCKEHENDPQIF